MVYSHTFESSLSTPRLQENSRYKGRITGTDASPGRFILPVCISMRERTRAER